MNTTKNIHVRLIPLLVFFISLQSFGQLPRRIIDTRVEIVSPAEGSLAYSPSTVAVRYKLVNQGPDTLLPTDSFGYYLQATYNGAKSRRLVPIPRVLIPNDSFYFEDSIAIDIPASYTTIHISFKGIAQVTIGRNPDPVRGIAPEFWETKHDNYPVLRLNHLRKSASITDANKKLALTVFPNPIAAGETLHLTTDTTPKRVSLVAITGEQVLLKSYNNSWIIPAETGSGIYLLRVEQTQSFVTKTLIIKTP